MPFFGGEGYGPNGVLGSWIPGISLQGGVVNSPFTKPSQVGICSQNPFTLAPGPATLPTFQC